MDYDQQVYPYERHPEDAHPMAWLFFNVPDTPRFQLEVADKMVRHLEALGVDLTVGKTRTPEKKYDAVGSSGGPWESGMWIDWDEDRAPVVATAADKNITSMTEAERAELRAALDAAEDAERGRS